MYDPLRRGMRGPGGCSGGGIWRRTHTRFIGKHPALKAAGERLADGVAHRARSGLLPAESAAENDFKNRRQGGDMPQADNQAGQHPQ